MIVEREPHDLAQRYCQECFIKRTTPMQLDIFRITLADITVQLCERHIGELAQALSKEYFRGKTSI